MGLRLNHRHGTIGTAPRGRGPVQSNHRGRVEAVTILGGDYGAAGGLYTFRGGTLADVSVAKVGGGGNVASPRSVGWGDMAWAPVLLGNLGHLSAVNTFQRGYLQGNETKYDTLAAQLGGGDQHEGGLEDHLRLREELNRE